MLFECFPSTKCKKKNLCGAICFGFPHNLTGLNFDDLARHFLTVKMNSEKTVKICREITGKKKDVPPSNLMKKVC